MVIVIIVIISKIVGLLLNKIVINNEKKIKVAYSSILLQNNAPISVNTQKIINKLK